VRYVVLSQVTFKRRKLMNVHSTKTRKKATKKKAAKKWTEDTG
jgi:hypothetical protein